MKFTKWLLVPAMALGLFTVGCGRPDEAVVEAPEVSAEDQAAADAAYEQQYNESMNEDQYTQ